MTEHTEPQKWLQLDPGRSVGIPVQEIALDELTVEAWFRYDNYLGEIPWPKPFAPSGTGPVVEVRKGSKDVQLWCTQISLASLQIFSVRIGGVGPDPQSWDLSDFQFNKEKVGYWQHMAWILEKTETRQHRFTFLLDGFGYNYWDSPTISGYPKDTCDHISIGAGLKSSCDIAQVRLWNRALSQRKILSNMRRDREHSDIAQDRSGLVGWWKMDDLTDDPIPRVQDSSGKGHHGTIVTLESKRVGSRGQARRALRGRSG